MIWLLIFFLASCAVKCEENNYYVIQMPEADSPSHQLQVYWNVPTMQCSSKKIPFKNLDRFGILQNNQDSFRGETIAIMYDPGDFPALFRNGSSGNLRYRNGGVPQEGDLDLHIRAFKSVLEQSIPDEGFRGIGIIDFESWRPILRQNFGDVLPYKSISYEIERKKHWWWPQQWIHAEAKQRFEEAARKFMQTSISVAKQMRPAARWGYYGFPYCFNMRENSRENCASNVQQENDQIDWLWMESTALYPSVYSSKDLTSSQLSQLIRGRVTEAARVRRMDTPILPYFWFRYRDGGFLSEEDLYAALKTFNQSEASGFIIWGSSNDVNTADKCTKLLNYVENVMGPAIAKFAGGKFIRDEIVEETTTTHYNETRRTENTTEYVIIREKDSENENVTAKKPSANNKRNVTGEDNQSDTTVSLEEDSQDWVEVDKTEIQYNKTANDGKETLPKRQNESVLVNLLLNSFFSNLSKGGEVIFVSNRDNNNSIDTTENYSETAISYSTENIGIETSTHLDTYLVENCTKIATNQTSSTEDDPDIVMGNDQPLQETSTVNGQESTVSLYTDIPPRSFNKYNKACNDSKDECSESAEDDLDILHYVTVRNNDIGLVTNEDQTEASTYMNTDIPPRLYEKLKPYNTVTTEVSALENSKNLNTDVLPKRHHVGVDKYENRLSSGNAKYGTENSEAEMKNTKVVQTDVNSLTSTENYIDSQTETTTLFDEANGFKNIFYNQDTLFNPMILDDLSDDEENETMEVTTEDDSDYSLITEKFYIFNDEMHKELLAKHIATIDESVELQNVNHSGPDFTNIAEDIKSTSKTPSLEYNRVTKTVEDNKVAKNIMKEETKSTIEELTPETDILLETVTASSDQVVVHIV